MNIDGRIYQVEGVVCLVVISHGPCRCWKIAPLLIICIQILTKARCQAILRPSCCWSAIAIAISLPISLDLHPGAYVRVIDPGRRLSRHGSKFVNIGEIYGLMNPVRW